MQIRLSAQNSKNLDELRKIYRATDEGYNLSSAQQCNLLLTGRLTVVLSEAKKELKKKNVSRRS